ncbi:MAG: hypothetical protein ABGZ53_11095, partial [Fuerstiella sp.]
NDVSGSPRRSTGAWQGARNGWRGGKLRGRRLKQVGADKRRIKLNKDHETADLKSMEIIVTVQVWQAGADGIRRDH